jgi:hypothetical protein
MQSGYAEWPAYPTRRAAGGPAAALLRYYYLHPILNSYGNCTRDSEVAIAAPPGVASPRRLDVENSVFLLEKPPDRFIRYAPDTSEFLHRITVVRVDE